MKESEKIWFILAVVFASIAVLLLVLTMPEAEVCHREIDPKTKKPGPEWCSTKTLFGLMTMSNSLKQDLQKKVETAAGNQWQNDTEDLLFLSRNFFLTSVLFGVVAVTLLAFPICTGLYKNGCYTTWTFVATIFFGTMAFITDVFYHYYVSFLTAMLADVGKDPQYTELKNDLVFNNNMRLAFMDAAVFFAVFTAVCSGFAVDRWKTWSDLREEYKNLE